MATQTAEFSKFHQFSKLEDGQDGEPATVWGVATWEQPDSDNESCCYETAKPVYQAWSSKAFKRTKAAGQEPSLGNLRIQHSSEVGGKATKLHFDDDAKEVWLGSEPISDTVYQQLKKGFLTGYSQGGSYAWRCCSVCESAMPMQQGANFCENCGKNVMVRYGLRRIAEVSYVDSPATGEGFEHVKANGSCEIVKFAKKIPEVPPVAKEKRTRDAEAVKTSTAKALEMLKSRIDKEAETKGLAKGLYQVGHAADLLQGIASLWESACWEREIEGDESTVPDELKDLLDNFVETFIAMATEEAHELAAKKTIQPGEKTMTPEEMEVQKAANKARASHFAKAAAHHEKMADMHEATADHHEGLAEAHKAAHEDCKDCMGKSDAAKAAKLAKADTDPEDAEGDETVHHVLENQVTFHKAAEKEHKGLAMKHDKMAKAHDKFAEHLHKCAKDSDMEEAEKTVKEIAAFDAANPDATIEKEAPKPVTPSLDADVEKARMEYRNTPEYKEMVSNIAKSQETVAMNAAKSRVDAEVAALRDKVLAPLGTPIGEALKENQFRIAQRDEPKLDDIIAKRDRSSDTAGL